MDGWNTTFLLGRLGLFSGAFAVSFREGTTGTKKKIQQTAGGTQEQHVLMKVCKA